MLEQIFGSKTRVQIINLFIRNPETGFYVREIARISGQYINSIRRELANLERFGFLKSKNKIRKKFYYIDNNFFLTDEIKNLFLKAEVFLENNLTSAVKKIGDVKLLVFTGSFTGAKTKTDLLIVGDKIKSRQLRKILENFGLTAGQEVKYTVFSTKEYEYRQGISDHFIQNIFNQKNIVVVDKLSA